MELDAVLKALGASGTGVAGLALMWSLVRKRIARDNADADQSRGESNWIKRQQDELADKEAANKLLIKALQARDETLSALRIKEVLYLERDKRQRGHVRRLESRLRRIDPNADDWLSSDNAPLGPPEID